MASEKFLPTVKRESCGTYAGYAKHLAKRDEPCEPCRAAKRDYVRDNYAKNPEVYARQKYRKKNDPVYSASYKESQRKYTSKRRAILSNSEHAPYVLEDVLREYGTNCHLCLEAIDLDAPRAAGRGRGWERGLQIDHLVPLKDGGPDSLENVRPTHALCNLSKGAKDAIDSSHNVVLPLGPQVPDIPQYLGTGDPDWD